MKKLVITFYDGTRRVQDLKFNLDTFLAIKAILFFSPFPVRAVTFLNDHIKNSIPPSGKINIYKKIDNDIRHALIYFDIQIDAAKFLGISPRTLTYHKQRLLDNKPLNLLNLIDDSDGWLNRRIRIIINEAIKSSKNLTEAGRKLCMSQISIYRASSKIKRLRYKK